MTEKDLQLEDTVSADRKERIIYVGPGKTRKISSITSRQNFNNEKFTRKANKGEGEDEEDDQEEVKESAIQPTGSTQIENGAPTQSDTISKSKKPKSNSPQIEFVTGTQQAGSSSTAIGNAQNMGIKKISEALVQKAIKQVKADDEWDDKNPPFDPDTKAEKEFKKPHNPNRSPMDTVRALAQKAMNKQKGVKEEVETIDEKTADTSKNKWVLGTKSDPHKTKPRASHTDDGVPALVGGFPQGESEEQKPHDRNATMKSTHKAKWSGAEHDKKMDEEVVQEGVLGAVAGAVLGGLTAGPAGAVAGGYLGHKTQQAGDAKDQLTKRKVKKEETEMSKTYKEFLDQLLEYTPGPGGVTRVQGRSYGAQYHDPEGDDDADDKAPAAKPADAPKRGRGRPKGATSGANHKVTSGKKSSGVDYTGFKLHLPNTNR